MNTKNKRLHKRVLEHWKQNLDNVILLGELAKEKDYEYSSWDKFGAIDIDAASCPFCNEYFKTECFPCPIYLKTTKLGAHKGCEDTPYSSVVYTLYSITEVDTKRKINCLIVDIIEELLFLESL